MFYRIVEVNGKPVVPHFSMGRLNGAPRMTLFKANQIRNDVPGEVAANALAKGWIEEVDAEEVAELLESTNARMELLAAERKLAEIEIEEAKLRETRDNIINEVVNVEEDEEDED